MLFIEPADCIADLWSISRTGPESGWITCWPICISIRVSGFSYQPCFLGRSKAARLVPMAMRSKYACARRIRALTSAGLADVSEAVLGEMQAKHPQSPPVYPPPGPVPPPIVLHEAAIRKGVLSFPRGSAPGPSGLRPSHLHEATTCPSPDLADQLLSTLTRFVNLLA